jgi:hypothetical protein
MKIVCSCTKSKSRDTEIAKQQHQQNLSSHYEPKYNNTAAPTISQQATPNKRVESGAPIA